MTNFVITISHVFKGKEYLSVLLRDGAFASPDACRNTKNFCVPKLFSRKADAIKHSLKYGYAKRKSWDVREWVE